MRWGFMGSCCLRDTALDFTSRLQEQHLNALHSIQSCIFFHSIHSEKQIAYELYFSKRYERLTTGENVEQEFP